MKRIRTGDTVIVIAGKSKGRVGKVLKVSDDRVTVENVNLISKHVKPNPKTEDRGGIVSKEASLHVSNVAMYNTSTNKRDRIGFRFVEKDGARIKVRYFKSTDQVVDNP